MKTTTTRIARIARRAAHKALQLVQRCLPNLLIYVVPPLVVLAFADHLDHHPKTCKASTALACAETVAALIALHLSYRLGFSYDYSPGN